MGDLSGISSSSSNSKDEKPVVVRVKRKSTQAPLDALWLEINERPLKRPLLDFGNLSISSSSADKGELKTKKVLVQHVETVRSSEETKSVLQSFMPNYDNAKEFKMKLEERRRMFKQDKKHDQLRLASRQEHEDLVRSARFEQLWKSRKGDKETGNDPIHEFCHLYDVVRIDVEEEMSTGRQKHKDSLLEDETILCNYMPLLREFLPTAASEIESEINAKSSQQDGYVYDFYTVGDDSNDNNEDSSTVYPLVQVDEDDDYYDGPIQSEFESDDSNAEDNPRNDYPDEESLEEEELESSSSCDQSEDEENMYEEEIVDDDEEVDRRWGYR